MSASHDAPSVIKQEQADVRKFLIATTALVLMSATANASNLWEEGIAATLFYEANCGGGIPRDMLMVAKIYERDHPAQIQHRIDEIMSDLKSDVFSVRTATKIWCATMRPTISQADKDLR
ncbi:MAG: hypothetical protein WBD15_04820 [Pseudolabrys sp.]